MARHPATIRRVASGGIRASDSGWVMTVAPKLRVSIHFEAADPIHQSILRYSRIRPDRLRAYVSFVWDGTPDGTRVLLG